ncbi:TPA: hypothetical protein ACH3X1_016781 [Trebouxia sp. C0004]
MVRTLSAFQGAKHALTSSPVSVLPDYGKPFEGAMRRSLTQVQYCFKRAGMLHMRVRNYPLLSVTTHQVSRSSLLWFHAMRTWCCYLEGVPFRMVTDHHPLVFLQTQANLSRRQVRWSKYLQAFRFSWQYRPGRSNVADPLSRVQVVTVAAVTRGKRRCAVPGVPPANPSAGPDADPSSVLPSDPGTVLPQNPDFAVEQESLTDFQLQVQQGYKHALRCSFTFCMYACKERSACLCSYCVFRYSAFDCSPCITVTDKVQTAPCWSFLHVAGRHMSAEVPPFPSMICTVQLLIAQADLTRDVPFQVSSGTS